MYKEVESFVRYLVSREASPILVERYETAIKLFQKENILTEKNEPFEAKLLAAATKNHILTASLDSVAAFAAPNCQLRKRLYIMAALLETSPEYADCFLNYNSGKIRLFMSLLWIAIRSTFFIAIGIPIFLWLKFQSR